MNYLKCGQHYHQEDVFCGNCGNKLSYESDVIIKKSSEITPSQQDYQHDDVAKSKKVNQSVEIKSDKQDLNQPHNINTTVVNQNDIHVHNEESHESKHHTSNEFIVEMKRFFLGAFTHPDELIKAQQFFSYKVLFALLVAGLLIISLLVNGVIPEEVAVYQVSKANIIFKFIVGIAIILTVHIGVTNAVIRLTILPTLKFNKVLSDYVLVNTFSVELLFISTFLFILNTYKFASVVLIVAYSLFTLLPAYLVAKYSTMFQTGISSMYGIIILLFAFSFIVLILEKA
ncbi:zinc ribbon domain-containing protein [Staphylococcus saccharolyticus]|uniref:zinc ribbon domain-containing protein n=1 Tax=Staphylococcus saccharolyticus TaxID=33028 RepID=UPI0032DFA967